jgi:serine phosphatase RsbU (regulator of sigma subunit)
MKIRLFFCLTLFSVIYLSQNSFCNNKITFLNNDIIKNNRGYWLVNNWHYHTGDNKTWSNQNFNDRDWQVISNTRTLDNLDKKNSAGTIWFRQHIKIDSSLKNTSLRIIKTYAGEIEVFLNGSPLVTNEGIINKRILSFSDKSDYVLAVRYSNPRFDEFVFAGLDPGFAIGFGNIENSLTSDFGEIRWLSSQQMFFTALILAFSLLHFILYLNYKQHRINLLYSIFLFVYALSLFMDYQISFSTNSNELLLYMRIHRGMMTLSTFLSLLFIYFVFQHKQNKIFWFISSLLFLSGLMAIISPLKFFLFLLILQVIVFVEVYRITILAIKKKQEGAWLITIGFSILVLFSLYDFFVDINFIPQLGNFENGYPFGTIGLFVCMSIYVAKDFAKANLKIIEQERIVKEKELERRLLEADNERKTKELEEARKLQLSILPKAFPQFDHLEIAAQMKTATEVGGDYYDYHISNDGTLTIVIGDATGHGTKAGIMVTLIKSLFDSMAHTFFIPDFFNHCTKIIKRMNLGNLYMGLSVVKIKNHHLTISAAGMPPLLYYDSDKKEVEEIILKGMPAGASLNFVYQQQTKLLKPGDTILMMTDGFVEMFNSEKELFDYPRARETFKQCAENTPEEIINYLFLKADEWQKNTEQEDDISFVVIKIK